MASQPARPLKRRESPLIAAARGSVTDGTWALVGYVVVLMLIPANLTIAPLGSVGTPALIIGLLGLIWWIGAQLNQASSTLTPSQPVRGAMIVFTIAVLISYIAATTRPLEELELSASDRGLLLIASLLGVVLLACDGLSGVDRVEIPLRALVVTGSVVAAIGIAQFATGLPLVDAIQIPGLSPNNDLTSIYGRGGFVRAAGTSTHPIEFGVVLGMVLPIALHFAFADAHKHKLIRWLPVGLIAFAIPITVSRSAIVAVVVVLAFLIPTWPVLRRWLSIGALLGVLAAVYVAIPGMLGALTGLFVGIAGDGSAQSRTNSYAIALDYIQRAPLFGRGFSTFLPQYRILDNQYLGLLIEVGIVGTLAILVLFLGTIITALRARRRSDDPRTKSLAQSLAAMVAAGAFSFATFDAFAFPQVAGLMFLGIGLVGAVSNSVRRPHHRLEPRPRRQQLS